MSALAIWYSGNLAFSQTRRAKREKIDTYVAVLMEADDAAQYALSIMEYAAEEEIVTISSSMDFEGLERSFRAISFHDTPDYRLVSIIRDAANCCAELRKRYDDKSDGSQPIQPFDYALAKPQMEKLKALREEAELISNGLMTPSERIHSAAQKSKSRVVAFLTQRHQSPPKTPEG
jgi:hypothetical protein